MYLATSAHIKQLDNLAVSEFSFTIESLMENAGKAIFNKLISDFPIENKFHIFYGKGNNGGDGLVLARLLSQKGFEVNLYSSFEYNELGEFCKIAYDKLDGLNINHKNINDKIDDGVIIDAIFGISLVGAPKDDVKVIIDKINSLDNKVVSIDIPSGLSCDNGKTRGSFIKADYTYTLALDKVGLNVYPGKEISGKVSVLDIGIPTKATQMLKFNIYKTDNEIVNTYLPKRKPDSHKGTYGTVGIIGGRKGMTGSICMAANAALRSGAGLCYIFVSDDIFDVVSSKVNEAIVVKESELSDYLNKLDVIAIGMGYSQNSNSKHIIKMVMQKFKKTVIIDADGINILSQNKKYISSKECSLILTPHPGEFSRLTDITIEEINNNRIYLTEKYAKEYNCTLLLKGASTVISSNKGEVRINPTGNSGMATAGSGDVLSGIIAGLSAQGADNYNAASIGAYIHGLSGDISAMENTEYSVIATDIINNISKAFKKIL